MKMETFDSIDNAYKFVKDDLDEKQFDKDNKSLKKISLLYASNASGKTRLSKTFYDKNEDEVLYYSAFTEDLFTWDNENYILKFDVKSEILKFINVQGLDRQVIDKFQNFIGSKLQPTFFFEKGEIIFGVGSGDDAAAEQIKISRGEESVFIWSIFSTYLNSSIEYLNEKEEERATTEFNKIKYVVIDDPVSSMDDSKIISIALDIAKLIHKSKENLSFFISTHHALFFNVLFNAKIKLVYRKCFVFTKYDNRYFLKTHGSDSPFAYHHVVISEIASAIDANEIKKYHLNLFRALLEKTANFIGFADWTKCLDGTAHTDSFKKIIHHYSHDSLSDLDYREIDEKEKNEFKEAFKHFIEKFKWGTKS